MNFEELIWSLPRSCVPSLYVLFSIYFLFDILRTFLNDNT